jgi:hypothetical protein
MFVEGHIETTSIQERFHLQVICWSQHLHLAQVQVSRSVWRFATTEILEINRRNTTDSAWFRYGREKHSTYSTGGATPLSEDVFKTRKVNTKL